jgi:hypothetical protein
MKINRKQLRKMILNEIGYTGGYRDSSRQTDPVEDAIDDVLTQYNLTGLIVASENNKNKGPSTLFVIKGNNSPLTDISYVKKVKKHLAQEMPEYEFRTKPDKLDKTNSAYVIQVNTK